MTGEMTTAPDVTHTELLDEGEVTEYAEERLFGDRIESLSAHTRRKQALADPFRYSVLYLLYEYGRISRTRLVEETGRTSNGLQHHLDELLETNLAAEIPAPEGADGRRTYYRITTLGKREVQSDIEKIVGGDAHQRRHEQFCDPSFLDGTPDERRRQLSSRVVTDPQRDPVCDDL
ncbi:MAG: winged helix-turn-helix domain-containing protein [Halobaculum sp.]